jgi:peptide/nickel transport system permease protein
MSEIEKALPGDREDAIRNKEIEGLSQGQIVFRRFIRHKAAMISVFVLLAIFILVFSALEFSLGPIQIPGWWKYSYLETPELRFEDCPGGVTGCPTLDLIPFLDGDGLEVGQHPFGQDNIGRDYFALVMRGTQRSLQVMIIIGLIAGILGTVVGAIAGYFRGWVDAILMRFTDFIIVIPAIIIGSVIGFHFGTQSTHMIAEGLEIRSCEIRQFRLDELIDGNRFSGIQWGHDDL